MRDMVLVLNYDNFASRAVTRKLRSERIFCKVVPGNISLQDIQAQEPLGLLLAGGVSGHTPSGMDAGIPAAGIPTLALGDAAGLLMESLGGEVGEPVLQGAVMELRYQESDLLRDVENGERLLPCAREMRLPKEVKPLCTAQETVIGFAHESLPLYGMQIEVEQNDPEGAMILRNFAFNICGCTAWWDEDAFVNRAIEEITRLVGDGRAVCAMTGGLNSGVSAMLAYKALGDRLKCIFVDTGLLREREADEFIAYYRDQIGMDIIRVNAGDRFLSALQGVTDADEKRRVIGETIRDILREEEAKLGEFQAVIRGVSCSDVMFGSVLSAQRNGAVLPIEPVRDLFKEEIRSIADFLGMPPEIVSRQPFPGSGLALRILGEVTPSRLQTLRAADQIFTGEIAESGQAKRLRHYFAVLTPLPENDTQAAIILRAVQAGEAAQQAYAARLPYDLLERVTERILRERPEVVRVVYDLSPSTHSRGVEWQ